MFLFLVHHGDALPPDVDPQRPLSTRGRMTVDLLAGKAARLDAKPAVIWHSGKLRARQTAEAFWRACSPLSEFSAIRGLQPTDPPEWIRERLNAEPRDVMLVGHMPNLAHLLRVLVGGECDPSTQAFPLNGVVALEHVEDRWVERWRLTADLAL